MLLPFPSGPGCRVRVEALGFWARLFFFFFAKALSTCVMTAVFCWPLLDEMFIPSSFQKANTRS